MSDGLSYECPHCRQTVRVAASVGDEPVDCPHCHRQFQAKLPLGRPAGENSGGQDRDRTSDAGSEQVLRQTHPVVFRNHLLLSGFFTLLLVAGLAGTATWLAGNGVFGLTGTGLLVASLLGLAAAAGFYCVQWLRAVTITLTVTNRRTVLKRGLLSRNTNEVQHDDIRNIKCDQNVMERLLNYGDISLSSAGQDYMEIVIHDVPEPQVLIGLIRDYQ